MPPGLSLFFQLRIKTTLLCSHHAKSVTACRFGNAPFVISIFTPRRVLYQIPFALP